MTISPKDRRELAHEIAVLLDETYAIGVWRVHDAEGQKTLDSVTEYQIAATVLEAINRTLDSTVCLQKCLDPDVRK